MHSLFIDSTLLLDQFGKQKFNNNGQHIYSVLLSQFRNIVGFLFLFACLLRLLFANFRLVSSATTARQTSKVDHLYHVFELDVVSESLEQLPVLSKHTGRVCFKKTIQCDSLKLRIVGIDQSQHQRLERWRHLPQIVSLLEQFQEAIDFRIGLPTILPVLLRVNHVCIGHLIQQRRILTGIT